MDLGDPARPSRVDRAFLVSSPPPESVSGRSVGPACPTGPGGDRLLPCERDGVEDGLHRGLAEAPAVPTGLSSSSVLIQASRSAWSSGTADRSGPSGGGHM